MLLASAQTLRHTAFAVSRAFYKDVDASFVASYKKSAGSGDIIEAQIPAS